MIAQYSEEKHSLDAKVQQVTARIAEWNERRQHEADKLDTLRKANDDLQHHIVELRDQGGEEARALRTNNAALRAELVAAKSAAREGEALRGEVEALRKTLAENESFLRLAKAAATEHTETVASYEAEVRRLETALVETHAQPAIDEGTPDSGYGAL